MTRHIGVLSLLLAMLSPIDNCFIWSVAAETSIIDVSGDVVGVVEELFICLDDATALYLGTDSAKRKGQSLPVKCVEKLHNIQ